ncbi:hypothetical protein [Actinoplanes subglobosus]|uniref:Uncharacterized protein n=1 Tax=Actinoplanes subglobosus TaxID=1547892 RepID=A0ABV8J4S5_9ACTN
MNPAVDDITTDLTTLAVAQGWTDVTTLLDVAGADDVLLLAAPGARLDVAGTVAPLEESVDTLRYHRVVAVLRCGAVLSATTLAAARAVLARPAGSAFVVVTGAEQLDTDDKVARNDRILWQSLIASGGATWHGQDLAEHHCLLWSDSATPSERVTRDMATLRAWLSAEPAATAEVTRLRLAHALVLAGEAGTAAPAVDSYGRLTRIAGQVQSARADVLRRLDSDMDMLRDQLTSLFLEREQELLAGGDVTAIAVGLAVDRLTAASGRAREMLDGIDWDLVNEAVPGGVAYPGALLAPLTEEAGRGAPDLAVAARTPRPGAASVPVADTSTLVSVVRAGAIATAVSALTMPFTGLPAAVVVGTSSGIFAERQLRERERAGREKQARTRSVTGDLDRLRQGLAGVVDTQRDRLRREVGAAFDRLADDLRTARDTRPAAASAASSAAGSDVTTRLDDLRARLAATGN